MGKTVRPKKMQASPVYFSASPIRILFGQDESDTPRRTACSSAH
jgi:hypothetical protein